MQKGKEKKASEATEEQKVNEISKEPIEQENTSSRENHSQGLKVI